MMNIEDKIVKALGNVNDPELGKSLVELNMVQTVSFDSGVAKVTVALTTVGCPLKATMKDDIVSELKKIDGVEDVEVEFTQMSQEDLEKVMEKKINISNDTTIVAVGSGKGGVGKSTVTANLAATLNNLGYKVGVIDADILGYSIPQIMGIKDERPVVVGGQTIIPVEKDGVKIISMGNLVEENQALIWRGPILAGVLEQFFSDVHWGDLDYLLLDLPPGTGDIPLSIMQDVKRCKFLIVTTPQITAKDVAKRLGLMAQKTNTEVLGVIENMSYFECDKCGEKHYIFGKGEGKKLSEELGVNFLGEIPLSKDIREYGDKGILLTEGSDTSIGKAYKDIAEKMINSIK